jgi:CheY-like chemotaxis protein
VTGHGAAPRATPAPPAGGVAPGDATILLVDDEEANLDLLAAVLRPTGYTRLVRVSDARTALAAFEDARPDLVLLDLHMPHRSGFEVLADLAARVPAAEFLPVLVLTADVTAQARERALAGGAHDFVLKPFDRTEVLLRVRNLLHARHLHLAQQRAREAAERQAARARLLADATRLLGLSFDTATALGALAGRLVPAWADGCAIEMDGGEGPVTVASAGAIGGEVLRVPLAAAEAPPVEDARPRERWSRHAARAVRRSTPTTTSSPWSWRAAPPSPSRTRACSTPRRRRWRRATACSRWSRTIYAVRSPPCASTSRCCAPIRPRRSPRGTRARSRASSARRRAWTP